MLSKLKYIVLPALLSSVFGNLFCQDVEMSQYFSAPLHLNPALAGISYGPRATLNYRNEWASMGDGFNGGYTTYMAGADMYIDKIHGGIGLLFTGDQIANNLYGSYKVSLMYAQQIKFNRKMALRIGISGSYIRTQIKWNQLLWSDMINPLSGFYTNATVPNPTSEPTPGNTFTNTGDMSAGLVFFTEKLYVGFAVNNMLLAVPGLQKTSFYGDATYHVPLNFVANFGANLPIRHAHETRYNIWISPNVLFVNQGNSFQEDATLLAGVSMVYFGLGYRNVVRNSDAVIGFLGFKKGKFRIGYSYDYTISRLVGRTGGTHELSFTFNWTGEDNSLNPKANKGYVPCPDILNF